MSRDPIAPLCDEIFARVMPRILSALSNAGEWSSTMLPPGCSRRTFRMRCATIPSARKIGKVWFVSKAAWFASGSASIAKPQRPANDAANADEELADQFLAGAGLRAPR